MSTDQKNKIVADLLPQEFGRAGVIWTISLIVVCMIGLAAYIHQIQSGLQITAMRDYASWGIYISNFVFFVAISLVGSLITAIFRLSAVEWRTPLTRISEIIAVSAILFASMALPLLNSRAARKFPRPAAKVAGHIR